MEDKLKSDFTPYQRAAIICERLMIDGAKLTTANIAEETGLGYHGAYRAMERISTSTTSGRFIVDEFGRWRYVKRRDS